MSSSVHQTIDRDDRGDRQVRLFALTIAIAAPIIVAACGASPAVRGSGFSDHYVSEFAASIIVFRAYSLGL